MQVTIPANVKEIIAKRGLKESDVMDVVNTAIETKHYLVKGNDALAKKVIGDLTTYVMLDMSGGNVVVKSAYAHKMKLGKIVNVMGETDWKCTNNGHAIASGHVEIEYMTVKRNGPALICPACNEAWVEEYLATKTLAAAEGLFEQKRA